jgi:periplasmic protein TonB
MFIAIALLLLLISAVAFAGNGWSNVLSSRRNDLVFAGRNQAYGAYVIRQEHHRVMLIAFLASMGTVGAALIVPKLLSPAAVAPPPAAPEIIVEFIDFVVPSTPVIPETPAKAPAEPLPKKPLENGPVVAKDSTITVEKDTTTHTPEPVPIGPKGKDPGPIGPLVGKTGGGDRDTTIREGYEADSMPEYPGGLKALYDDLGKIVRYPQIDIDRGKEGRVMVSFVVAEDGSLTNVIIGKGVTATMDAESLRAVRMLKKKWKPGTFRGKEVRVRYNLPIAFKLARQ